jgi:Protein of unknown function (DUF3553)
MDGNPGEGGGMAGLLEPGMLVRHPDQADWGLGQVQSVVGARVTVNFENAGKVVIDMKRIALVLEVGTYRP